VAAARRVCKMNGGELCAQRMAETHQSSHFAGTWPVNGENTIKYSRVAWLGLALEVRGLPG